jgi:hypothetical protein
VGRRPGAPKLFVVDEPDQPLPLEALVEEIRTGLEFTLVTRAQAHDPASLAEVEVPLQRLH